MRVITAKRFKTKKYKVMIFSGEWQDSFGNPEVGSKWIVYGNSGQGKTDMAVQIAGYLSIWGKVLYISKEEGDSASLQGAWKRHEISNKIALGVDFEKEDVENYLNKRRIKTVVVDSIDYMRLTQEDYKAWINKYNKINWVFISWAEGGKPNSKAAKAIEYMSDIKVYVRSFVASVRSRYGGGIDFIIKK